MTTATIFETTLRPRYQETDQMGVVYHTNYLIWFEVGRGAALREMGYSYQQFEDLGLLLPVVEIQCRYLAPAKYDEEILIRTHVVECLGGRLGFTYEVLRKEDETLLATGRTRHLWVNKEMKRINIAQSFPEFAEQLLAVCQKEEE